jgi:hypothetical protein
MGGEGEDEGFDLPEDGGLLENLLKEAEAAEAADPHRYEQSDATYMRVTFKPEPPFTMIGLREVERVFGFDPEEPAALAVRRQIVGLLRVVEVSERDDQGKDVRMTRDFGGLTTEWSPIRLVGAVNFLLRHPSTREIHFVTKMPLVAPQPKP